MWNPFSQLRDHSYAGSAMCPECSRKLARHILLVKPTGKQPRSRGVTKLDGARGKKQVLRPMFEPEVFRKQMCCVDERTCDIVGTFRGPPQWFGARGIVLPLLSPCDVPAQKSSKARVKWLPLWPCLVPSWCGASRTIWNFCWPWGISSLPTAVTSAISLEKKRHENEWNEYHLRLGLPDGRNFTGLAGILLLI